MPRAKLSQSVRFRLSRWGVVAGAAVTAVLMVRLPAGAQPPAPQYGPEDAVVLVRTVNSLRTSRGSGFLIGDGSWVVTAGHVISISAGSEPNKERRAYDRTALIYSPWTGRPYEARVVAVDARADVALLRLPPGIGLPALPLEGLDRRDPTPSLEALRDRPLRLFGFPLAYGEATIAALARPQENDSRLREIARRGDTNLCVLRPCPDAQPGWSGGPILNRDGGTVVGVFHSLYHPRDEPQQSYPAGALSAYVGDLLRQAGVTDLAPFEAGARPTTPRPEGATERMAREIRSLSWSAGGKWAEAEAEQRAILQQERDDALARVELGRLLLVQGKIDAAVTELREAARLAPGSVTAHFTLARALHQQGQPGEALPVLQAALQASPDEVEPRLLLARIHQEAGRKEESETVLREALQRSPSHPLVMYALGNLQIEREPLTPQKYQEHEGYKALKEAAKLAADEPSLSFVIVAHGRALEAIRRFTEAEAAYRDAVRSNANDALAYFFLSQVCLRQRRVEEAQGYLSTGVNLPTVTDALLEAYRTLQLRINDAGSGSDR